MLRYIVKHDVTCRIVCGSLHFWLIKIDWEYSIFLCVMYIHRLGKDSYEQLLVSLLNIDDFLTQMSKCMSDMNFYLPFKFPLLCKIWGSHSFVFEGASALYLHLHGQEVKGPTTTRSHPQDVRLSIPACHCPSVTLNVCLAQTSHRHVQSRKSSPRYHRIR